MNLNDTWDQLAWFWFKGDVLREDRASFLLLRIFYILFITAVIAGLTAVILISTIRESLEHESVGPLGFLLWGFVGVIAVLGILLVTKVLTKVIPGGDSMLNIVVNRAYVGFLLIFPAFLGLLLGTHSEEWYQVLPLFICSGLALLWKFPTQKKWKKWVNEMKPKPPREIDPEILLRSHLPRPPDDPFIGR